MSNRHPRLITRIQVSALVVLMSWGLSLASHARALDKQASAHAGEVSGADSGFALSGSALLGAAIYNPTYAARPNNTGKALLRFAPHFDIDLIGSRLSIPVDLNLFTDRERPGLAKLAPSELDVISGVTSTWPLAKTALELGARVEGDLPIDRSRYSQAYVDARARWLFALASMWPAVQQVLSGGDISGAATLGWFAYNPSYAARPDNTGRALLRYALHVTVHYTPHVFLALDSTFFTDRRDNAVVPSECDFTAEVGAKIVDDLELHLAYERDMPLNRSPAAPPHSPMLVQHFLILHLSWGFSVLPHAS